MMPKQRTWQRKQNTEKERAGAHENEEIYIYNIAQDEHKQSRRTETQTHIQRQTKKKRTTEWLQKERNND